MEHPEWCDPAWCTAAGDPPGAHASTPARIPLDEHGFETAVIRLTQRCPVPAWPNPVPVMQLEVYDGFDDADGGLRYIQPLRIGRAWVLAAVLRSMVRLADP